MKIPNRFFELFGNLWERYFRKREEEYNLLPFLVGTIVAFCILVISTILLQKPFCSKYFIAAFGLGGPIGAICAITALKNLSQGVIDLRPHSARVRLIVFLSFIMLLPLKFTTSQSGYSLLNTLLVAYISFIVLFAVILSLFAKITSLKIKFAFYKIDGLIVLILVSILLS